MNALAPDCRLNWHGKWIWSSKTKPRRIKYMDKPYEYSIITPEEQNIFILFRQHIKVENNLEKAKIYITADSRYKLFINGKYIGRGINRCEAYYWYYDEYDITSFLNKGDNIIAIHARFYGMDFAYYTRPELAGWNPTNSGKGGLLFDVNLQYQDSEQWVGSSKETKMMINEGEKSLVPLRNDSLGFVEEFDSRKCPKNWNELNFDDSKWITPTIYEDYPIKTLIKDPNAPLFEEFIAPSKIVVAGESEDIRADEDFDEEDFEEMDFNIWHMLEGPINPGFTNFNTNEINKILTPSTDSDKAFKITGDTDNYVAAILLQFPREMVGYPQLIVEGPEGTIIDLIPTEKIQNNLPLYDFTNNKTGTRLVLRGGKQFFEQWDWQGYLYLLVKIRSLHGTLTIYSIGTNRTRMQLRGQGKFECNNKKFEELWQACAYTLECCAIDAYLDCPSREQRAYVGDGYPEALIANACFGEPRLTRKMILDVARGQRKDGITFSFHPGDYQLQLHIIPDYTFYWIQMAEDYVKYYGEEEILSDLYPYFLKAINWFWKYIDPKTQLLINVPYWMFIDWSFGHEKPGYNAIFNTQFMDVLRIVANIAYKEGDIKNADRLNRQYNIMKTQLDNLFWDEKYGCYKDYLLDGELHGISFHTNAYLPLKGVAPREKWEIILENVFDAADEELIKKQVDNLHTKNLSHHAFEILVGDGIRIAQPFFMHHVNKFLAATDRFDLMIKFFEHGWLPMLELGETGTIWETWAKEGSECHAWAATPAYDLSSYWLGVEPKDNGFSKVKISPTFYGLDNVKGSFPTIKGHVEVEWQKKNTKDSTIVTIKIKIPNKIEKGYFELRPIEGIWPQKVIDIITNEELIYSKIDLKPGTSEFEILYPNKE